MPPAGIPWRGDLYSALQAQAAARGLTKGAEYLRGRSVPLTPRLTSVLRQSAQVVAATTGDLRSAVVFNTPYAVRQHEELGYRHRFGQAKYLEQPLVDESAAIFAIVAQEMRGVV